MNKSGAQPAPIARRVTMQDVATRAGVSRALVSMAIRGMEGVSAESKALILDAAAELGYRHNAVAAQLAARHSKSLGFFLLDIYNEVFADIFTGLRTRAEARDTRVVLSVGQPSPEAERRHVDGLLTAQVGTVVFAGTMLPDEALEFIARTVPVVTVTRLVPGIDSVACDDYLGGDLATKHLLEAGHRSVAYFGPLAGGLYPDRRNGYRNAMEQAGLQPRVIDAELNQLDAARAATELLQSEHRPTAIFAHNDIMAIGVMEAAAELGLDIPKDLSVIGYDDTRVSRLHRVGLTSVNQQASRLGEIAGDLALRRMNEQGGVAQHTLLTPHLVARSTVGTVS
ncbi:LacI family DNA-binding transcriptional regulator [Gulosibacter chungangensis]|uniref:LacI family transcriptional regulator n=1 Tax=Gulosibacter chungangensis TaxID=979746 RepID=A0A7J5BAB3_9MICO|nr:LacI family DNA-binding transcriptional regulator [Gulosibacter chungangensis]KAB1642708.1 LacI family transcriptional regulator [Gulosibacter chungangensis]